MKKLNKVEMEARWHTLSKASVGIKWSIIKRVCKYYKVDTRRWNSLTWEHAGGLILTELVKAGATSRDIQDACNDKLYATNSY